MCEGRGQRKRGLDQPQWDRERGHTGHRHRLTLRAPLKLRLRHLKQFQFEGLRVLCMERSIQKR